MGGLCGKTDTETSNTNYNKSGTRTTAPNIPDWWMKRYNSTDSAMGGTGMTPNQQAGEDWLLNRVRTGGPTQRAPGALDRYQGYQPQRLDEMHSQYQGANNIPGLYWDQYNSTQPNLAGSVSAGDSALVSGTRGADYASPYNNAYTNDYVDASLADYDAGGAKGLNALKAGNAGAFGNKRTGVAEAAFLDDFTRGRGTLSSGLRKQALDTSFGLGQTDADRFYGASGQNALNINQMKQYNAGLEANRQQFNAGQKDVSDRRLLDILKGAGDAFKNNADLSKMISDESARGVGVAGDVDTGARASDTNDVNAAGALGEYGSMGIKQLLGLLGVGTAGIGETDDWSESGSSSSKTKKTEGTNWLAEFAKLAATACWVAREVYGVENPRWMLFRQWLFTKAPRWLVVLYIKHGEKFARFISDKPRIKSLIRRLMDRAIGALA